MREKIKPVLTAEEWKGALAGWRPDLYRADDDTPEAEHAAAALYLHGYLTWEDVAELRGGADAMDGTYLAGRMRSIADRIEALLPPEAP